MTTKGKVIPLGPDWHRQLATRSSSKGSAANQAAAQNAMDRETSITRRPGREARALQTAPASETLFTVNEIAAHLKFRKDTVYGLIRTGALGCERHGMNGRTIRIPASALAEYKRKRLVG